MILHGGEDEPLLHGGNLGAARRQFPGAPEPFIDLSTGINPKPYPLPRFSAELFARLPDIAAADVLAETAARAYGAATAAHIVSAPGTQILLPLVAGLARPGRAAILTPTYPELSRAAILAGHAVKTVRRIEDCGDATLVIVGNPNNPDGRLIPAPDFAHACTRPASPRRCAGDRRGLHGCRAAGGKSRRRRGGRKCRRAALVRQIFRSRWRQARLRNRGAGSCSAARRLARPLGSLGTRAGCRYKSPGRHRLDRADA